MKNKVLVIFKYPRAWNIDVVNRFSNYYDTEYLYISDYKDKNFTEIIKEINDLIQTKNIEIVVFDVDYFKFINFFFIEKINCKKKILITGDDFELHEMNAITASACDMVLTGCPLSKLKYKEKGYEAHFINFENSKIKKNTTEKKDIDVLFFGGLNEERRNFLNYLDTQGIKVKIVGKESGNFVTDEELSKLISRSKIVLNLSKSLWGAIQNYSSVPLLDSDRIYEYNYILKGRVYIAGLCGTVCVSEYFPSHDMIFKQDEMPTFFTKEECAEILNRLLKDEKLLSKYTSNFTAKVYEVCEDVKNFQPIYNQIEKPNYKKVKILNIPYWYLRIAAKQIITRNVRLSNLIKTLSEFKIILEIIKDSNIIIKFLVLLESIVNILWYPVIMAVKSKKF